MNQDDANEVIEKHMAEWSGELATRVDGREILRDLPYQGFAVFAADMLEQTIRELESGDHEIAHDVVYSINQEHPTYREAVTVEQVSAWLEQNDARLIEALREALGEAEETEDTEEARPPTSEDTIIVNALCEQMGRLETRPAFWLDQANKLSRGSASRHVKLRAALEAVVSWLSLYQMARRIFGGPLGVSVEMSANDMKDLREQLDEMLDDNIGAQLDAAREVSPSAEVVEEIRLEAPSVDEEDGESSVEAPSYRAVRKFEIEKRMISLRRSATLELCKGRNGQYEQDVRKVALRRAESALNQWLGYNATAKLLGLELQESQLEQAVTMKIAIGRREQRRLGVVFG